MYIQLCEQHTSIPVLMSFVTLSYSMYGAYISSQTRILHNMYFEYHQ